MRWYIVQAFSGFEKQVQRSLIERINRSEHQESFGQVLVPTEEVIEMRDGKKRKSERKFFPGYVLIEMDMNDNTWHLVKDCPRVMGFIGGTPENIIRFVIEDPFHRHHRAEQIAARAVLYAFGLACAA